MIREWATEEGALREYVIAKVDGTLRPPNRMMKYPFIDPGSVYEGNLWDWDSFWAAYALLHLRPARTRQCVKSGNASLRMPGETF